MHSSTVAVLLLSIAAGQSAIAAPTQWTKVEARDAELDARTQNSRALLAVDERSLFSTVKDAAEKGIDDVGDVFFRRDEDEDDNDDHDDNDNDEQVQASRRTLDELLERELDERSFAALIPKLGKLLPHFIAPAAVAAGAGLAGIIGGSHHSSAASDAPAATATAPVDAPTAVGGTTVPAERNVVEYLAQRGVFEDYLANELSGRSFVSGIIQDTEKALPKILSNPKVKTAGKVLGGPIISGVIGGLTGGGSPAPPTVIIQSPPAPVGSAAAPSATSAPAARDIVDHLIQRELNDRSLTNLFKNPIVQELGGSAVENLVSKVFSGHGSKATASVITVQAPPAATAPAAANPAAAPPSRRLFFAGEEHLPVGFSNPDFLSQFSRPFPSSTAIAHRRDSDDNDVARVMSMFS
ncbi:hypothetical protein FA95DRAFT_1611091 [Auriscalpium vulgare]|uniref:Uncharacterized protein n=1 Tax=Auriscalpium vulgare TaxID=40419 RepID=A0ACB8RBA8_9AGAM|nr:hypothetical protein FA95DRAFT_1611091 [Auriscalpium vulgare]